MRRSLMASAGCVLAALIAGHAYAGTSDAPAVPTEAGKKLKTDQSGSAAASAPAKSGSSVVERDRKRYENQKRAAERRAAEMKKAAGKAEEKKGAKKKEPIDAPGNPPAN